MSTWFGKKGKSNYYIPLSVYHDTKTFQNLVLSLKKHYFCGVFCEVLDDGKFLRKDKLYDKLYDRHGNVHDVFPLVSESANIMLQVLACCERGRAIIVLNFKTRCGVL